MSLERRCPKCSKESKFVVYRDAWYAWQSGALIQDAFPDLTASERETIMTGYDQQCWEEIFGKEEE